MKHALPKLPVWLHIVLWSIYIAIISLYGEFIISRPANEWLQYGSSVVVLIGTYYWFRFSIRTILSQNNKHK